MDDLAGTGTYYDRMRSAEDDLAGALAAIRAGQDAGRLTQAEAAAERSGLLERHIDLCRQLRREHHLDGSR